MKPIENYLGNNRFQSAWLFAAVCFLLIFSFRGTVLAQIPDKPDPPRLVNDFAQMLSPQQIQQLEQQLVALDDSTGNQIAIVTVTTLGDYEVADFSEQLFQKWGIGQKNKNNGLLILISKNEHKSHIEVGYGLEGAVPDVVCKRILQDEMKPLFKKGQFYEGLSRAANILSKLASGEYKTSDYTDANRPAKQSGKKSSPFSSIIGIIILIIVIRVLMKNPWLLLFMGSGGGGGRSGGGFGDFSSGRGDFGGFGGGSSGGGGASGDW